jgi:hypothetical protein
MDFFAINRIDGILCGDSFSGSSPCTNQWETMGRQNAKCGLKTISLRSWGELYPINCGPQKGGASMNVKKMA